MKSKFIIGLQSLRKYVINLSYKDYIAVVIIFVSIALFLYFVDLSSLLTVPSIFSGLLTISLMQLYFDDFKLSKTKIIKYMQIFSFTVIPLYIIYYMYYIPFATEIMFSVLKSRDIYIALCMIIPSAMIAKTLAESSVSPLWKIFILFGAYLLGGFTFVLLSFMIRF